MPHHELTELPKAHPACEDAMSCRASRLIHRAEKAEAELERLRGRIRRLIAQYDADFEPTSDLEDLLLEES